MSNWSGYKDKMPASGGGDLLKLEDNKPVKIRIVGEPFVVQSEYKGQPSTRFALKFYNQTAKVAQFILIPKTPLNQILDLADNEDWGDPELYDITLTRRGSGLETEYSVQPSPTKGALPKKQTDEVAALDLKSVLERFPSISFAVPLAEVDDEFWRRTRAASKEAEEDSEDSRLKGQKTDDVVIEDIDKPINLEDIPF